MCLALTPSAYSCRMNRDMGKFSRGRYRLFVVRLSEDPGPARIPPLHRENTQGFSVDANYTVPLLSPDAITPEPPNEDS